MNPIIRTHTKEDMRAAKEGKQEDTMCKETNCNNPKLRPKETLQCTPQYESNRTYILGIPVEFLLGRLDAGRSAGAKF